MPNLYVIAGCNGAGKTTGSFTILPEILDCSEFVNADLIAYGLSPLNQDRVAFEAGRMMLKRMDQLLTEGIDFAFETTLASRSYVQFIKKAKQRGYKVTLLFFWLESPDMARDRVAMRVLKGGHHIPPDVVERRYYRGLKNLKTIYIPLCNDWLIVNNTETPAIIARGGNDSAQIMDKTIWSIIEGQIASVEEEQVPYNSDLHWRIEKGLQKAYQKLVRESAAKEESLVVFLDGRVQHVPARELLHRAPEPNH